MSRHIDNIIEAKGALILGAGVAGLFTALKLAPFPALVLAGARPGVSGSSAWAQGGIAAAMDENDSLAGHAADTLAAGAGTLRCGQSPNSSRAKRRDASKICSRSARRSTASRTARSRWAARPRIRRNRIVHVKGDRAGAEVTRILAERALETPSITNARRLSRPRTGDGGWPRRRRLRALRHRRACAPRPVPRPGGDLRHRRRRRALCASRPIRRKRAAKASAWRRARAR